MINDFNRFLDIFISRQHIIILNRSNQWLCTACLFFPQCIYCVPNQPQLCIFCGPGCYLNQNLTCSPCPQYCNQCTSLSDSSNLIYNVGITIVYTNNQSTVGVCDPGCSQCSQIRPNSCIACIPGFYLAYNLGLGICSPCNSSCFSCYSNDPNNCTFCFAGGFLTSNNTCLTCDFPCITCNAGIPTSCTSCPSGYVLYSNNICSLISLESACGQNCGTCLQLNSNVNPVCIICLAGYVILNNYCVPCPNTCGICVLNLNNNTQSQPICLFWNIGYSINSLGLCQPCGVGCGACINQLSCQTCLNGYQLTSTYTCIKTCIYPCAQCSSNNPRQCISCIFGFSLNINSQTCISNVNNCNSLGNCTTCPFGYSLVSQISGQKCVQCSVSSNCARCLPTNINVCISCLYGAFLSNGICSSCRNGCIDCLDLNTCFQCVPGFVPLLPAMLLTGSSANYQFNLPSEVIGNDLIYQPTICKPCTPPCVTCIGNTVTCLTCVQGSAIYGTQCVTNYNFGITIIFATEANTFSQNYYSLLANISSTINQQINSITVVNIQYGSVTISFLVSTNNPQGSAAANSQFNNLQNLLMSNQTVANMQISSSSVVINGAQDNGSNKSDTDLIIEIVVPIAVAIIIAIIIIVCVLRKRKQRLMELQLNMSIDSKKQVQLMQGFQK